MRSLVRRWQKLNCLERKEKGNTLNDKIRNFKGKKGHNFDNKGKGMNKKSSLKRS